MNDPPDEEHVVSTPAISMRQLVSDHHGVVYGYAFRLTGNSADAEDVSQQTFLTAQRHLHQLRRPDNPVPWLLSIARSCWMKSYRRQRPVAAAVVELNVDEVAEQLPADDVDREQIQLALDQLTDEFRLVVVMFYFEDSSYKEIAAALEIPIGTVMSRLARAKRQLRKLLAPAEDIAAAHQADSLGRAQKLTELKKSTDSKISSV